jgi:hypothetical protein
MIGAAAAVDRRSLVVMLCVYSAFCERCKTSLESTASLVSQSSLSPSEINNARAKFSDLGNIGIGTQPDTTPHTHAPFIKYTGHCCCTFS